MPNRPYAKEWLIFAYKNFLTAQKLYELDHFTDIIGVELQQSLEKMLKALMAFHNKPIPKTHKLIELAIAIDDIALQKKKKFYWKLQQLIIESIDIQIRAIFYHRHRKLKKYYNLLRTF